MRLLYTALFVFLFMTIYAQHDWVRTNPGGGGAIATVGATASGTLLAASDLSGIYRSYDNGQSWDVVGANQGLLETHVSSFGFDPNDGDVFFAGTYRGAYKTSDGGEHFNFVFPSTADDFGYSYIEDIAIAASNSTVGYLTHHESPEAVGSVYKTTDGGESWQAIAGNNLPTDLHLVKIMIHPSDENIVYVLTGKTRWGCSEANLYRSIDGGVHWVEIGGTEGDVLDMDLHPTDPNIVFMSTFESVYEDAEECMYLAFEEYLVDNTEGGEFYKSTDGGASFSQIGDKTGIISVGIDNPDIIRLMDVLFPYDWNDDAGTWETTNGGTTWAHTGFLENWSQGFTENQYYAYTLSFNGLNKTVTKDIFNSDRFYGSYGQWAWGSFDGGVTLNNISTIEVSPNHWISTGVENVNGHCIEVNEKNPNIVYTGAYDMGFWHSDDHGASWARTQPDYNTYPAYSWGLGDDVPENMAKRGAGSNVVNILSDPTREDVVWATFSAGQLSDPIESSHASTGLFKSMNNGEGWVLQNTGLPAYEESIRMYGLCLDPNSPAENRTLYITVDGDIYKSTTDGDSWNLVLENGGLKFLEVDRHDSNRVFAGGQNGLWRSEDAGGSWEEVGIIEMRKTTSAIRPDIIPTWVDWSDVENPVFPWEGVFDIKTDPNVADRMYVTALGPNKGLYRSDNGGNTWTKLITDAFMRGVAVAPHNSSIVYATASANYSSGGFGNSSGILYSTDAGETWEGANQGMAYNVAGMIDVETGEHPYVWVWSPGTGIQRAEVPFFTGVETVSTSFDLTISPNPTTGMLNISSELPITTYEVISPLGKILERNEMASNQVDISNLPTGLYFIKLISEAKGVHRTVKVIKK